MTGPKRGYHLDFEVAMAHQAELRAVDAQDRLARQAFTERSVRRHGRLGALLRDMRPRWCIGRARAAGEPGVQAAP